MSSSTGTQLKTLIEQQKYDEARRLVKSAPSTKSGAVLSRIDLEQAKTLMKQQKYKDARALLITNEDPGADLLLRRLNEMEQSKAVPATVQVVPALGWGWAMQTQSAPSSFTSRIMMVILFLCLGVIPGLMVLPVFVAEAKRYPDVPGAKAMLMLNRFIFYVLAGIAAFFVLIALVTFVSVNK